MTDDSTPQEPSFTLDEDGIPILKEVIDPSREPIAGEPEPPIDHYTVSEHTPKRPQKTTLDSELIKTQLRENMERDLHAIAEQIAAVVANDLQHQIEHSLRDALHSALRGRLNEALDLTLLPTNDTDQ